MFRWCGDISSDATSIAPASPNIASSSLGLIVIVSDAMSMLSAFRNDDGPLPITNAPFCGGLKGAEGGWGDGPPPLVRSRKASEEGNASGLPWCEVDSVEADDRVAVFLRMGRIHGGRDLDAGPELSGRGDSRGICVTVRKKKSVGGHMNWGLGREVQLTSTELLHQVARTKSTHVSTTEPPEKTDTGP